MTQTITPPSDGEDDPDETITVKMSNSSSITMTERQVIKLVGKMQFGHSDESGDE